MKAVKFVSKHNLGVAFILLLMVVAAIICVRQMEAAVVVGFIGLLGLLFVFH
jgi:hypothetical protein